MDNIDVITKKSSVIVSAQNLYVAVEQKFINISIWLFKNNTMDVVNVILPCCKQLSETLTQKMPFLNFDKLLSIDQVHDSTLHFPQV